MIRMFIGFDQVEAVAYTTLHHSILKYATEPVSITPVVKNQLKAVHDRPKHPKQSNEFAFTRFLVPYLCDYKGFAIFMDCDFLAMDDIKKLWDQRDARYAVQVVKHNHVPKEKIKYLGNEQTVYERKNWSSLILFNNEKCGKLTPEYVNTAEGLDLHKFRWLPDDEIGEIDKRWNYLVGYYPHTQDVSMVHFTEGGPYFDEYKWCDYSGEWNRAHQDANHVNKWVHATQSMKRWEEDGRWKSA